MTEEKVPLLETKGLKKYFKTSQGQLHAVDGIDLSIMRGETLGIVGESGCGKSTLGRTCIRLLEPTGGQILYNGQDVDKMNKKQGRTFYSQVSMIFQDPYASLNSRMSVYEIIEDPLRVNHMFRTRADRYAYVKKLMDTVGLASRIESSYPHELDGGRRQRVGIARALALSPEFIVCDEPVSALDVSIQAQILNLLMDLQEERRLTYMFITHDMSVVRHISTNIAVMYLGQCVEIAPCDELFEKPLHPYTQALLAAIPVPDIKSRGRLAGVINGEVTNPINPSPGCRFAPRCRYCTPECTKRDIGLMDMGNRHMVSCIRYAEK